MAGGLAARNGGKVGLAILVAVLLLGLGLRLDYAWKGRAPVYDASAYAKIAANLDAGEGFTLGRGATQPADNYSPGLPLFVAALYKASGGAHQRFARLVLALVGSLAVLFAYLIGRRLGGPAAGLVGAAIVAVYPALLEYQGMLMSEPLAATLLSGAVLSMLWASDRASPLLPPGRAGGSEMDGPSLSRRGASWVWLLPGALLGALALVRPEYLGVAALLALVVFARRARRNWRASLAQAAILIAGVALVVAPWTIRNAVALDRVVPISTGGGQVLFAGTYLPSGGDPEAVGAEVVSRHPEVFRPADARRLRLEQILARLAAERHPNMESDEALARMGREQLWDDLTEEPLEYAGFIAAKVGRIWLHGPRNVMREPLWAVFHLLVVALAALGLGVLAWRRRWEALLLGSILLAITAISALLVASPRRVLVMIPLLGALAGTGASWLWALGPSGIRHRLPPG